MLTATFSSPLSFIFSLLITYYPEVTLYHWPGVGAVRLGLTVGLEEEIGHMDTKILELHQSKPNFPSMFDSGSNSFG